MALADLVKTIQKLVQDNSTAILTGVGVAGTVSTAVLTGRASFKAARMIDRAVDMYNEDPEPARETFDRQDKAKLVWKLYIPPAATGLFTVTSIVLANR